MRKSISEYDLASQDYQIDSAERRFDRLIFFFESRRCHVVEIWMQVRRVPQLRSRRGNDLTPRLHGRRPEGSVCSC